MSDGKQDICLKTIPQKMSLSPHCAFYTEFKYLLSLCPVITGNIANLKL